jgi:hypothetical protein
MSEFKIDTNFHTPQVVAEKMAFMAYMLCDKLEAVLEPCPGIGQLADALAKEFELVFMPIADYWDMKHLPDVVYDAVVLNPPFSPVKEIERFVMDAMERSKIVIALLPWTYIVNSERRLKVLQDFGLRTVISLPRKTFPGCRVQVCIIELEKGHEGPTYFQSFTF